MDGLAELIQGAPLASVFGAAGLLCQLVWPLFRARKAIITAQFGIGANYSVQYAVLDAWSGAIVAGLGAVQSLIVLCAGERPRLNRVGLVLLPIVEAIGLATWTGIETLFALTAVTLIMVGRLQRDTLRLRMFLLVAAPFGIGYDVLVGALPALVGGILSALISMSMLVHEIKHRWPIRQPTLHVPWKPNGSSVQKGTLG